MVRMQDGGGNPFPALRGRKYLSLASFRRDGQPVYTPLWFAEDDGRVYIMTRDDSWKYKRIRNNPQVRVAPCTVRGRRLGPEAEARARVLDGGDFPLARRAMARKYWLMRLPFLWSRHNVFLELTPAGPPVNT
jgi:PPOX class probable F420-dependent enzyme